MAKYFQQNYLQNNKYDIKYKDINFKNLVETGKPYKSPNDNMYITQYIDDYSIAHPQQNKQFYVPVNKVKRGNHIKDPQSYYENNLLLMDDNNLDDQYIIENKYLQKQQNQNQIGRPDLPLFGEPYPRNIKQHLSPFFGCGNCFSVDSDEETQDTDNDIKENQKNEQKMQVKINQKPFESVKKQNEGKNYKKIEITVPKKAKGMDEELRLLSDIFNKNDKHCEWCHFDVLQTYRKKLLELEKIQKQKSQQEKKWEKIYKDFINSGGVSRAPEKFQQRKLIQKKREQQALEQFLEEYKKSLKPKKNRPWQEDINLDLCHKSRLVQNMKYLSDEEFQAIRKNYLNHDFQNFRTTLKKFREKSIEQQEDLNIDEEQNKNIEEYLNDNITEKQMIEKLIQQIQLKKQKKVQNKQDDFEQISLFEVLSELGLLKTISVDNFLQTLQNMMDKQNYQKDKIILPQFSLDQILKALQNQNNINENIQQTIKKSGNYANKDILNTLNQKEIGKVGDSKQQELVKNDLMKYLKNNQIQHEQCLIEGQKNKEQYDTYFKPSQQQVLNGNIFGKPYIKEFEKYMYDKKYEYILQTKKLSISEKHAKDYNDMVRNMMEKLGLTNKIDILQYLTPNKQGEIHPQIQAILDKYDYHCWVHLKNVLAQELKDKIEDLFKDNLKKINLDHNFNLKFKERPLEDYIEALKHLERPKKQYHQLITPHKDPKYLNLTQNLYGKSQKKNDLDYQYKLNEIPQKYHQEFNELQQMKNKQNNPVKQEDALDNENSQNLDEYQKYDFTKNLVSDSDSEDYLNDKNQNKEENQKEGEIDMKYSSFLNYTDKFEKSRKLREQEEKKEKRRREKQKIRNFLEKAKNLNDYVKQQKILQNQNEQYKQDQQFGVADFENAAYGSYYAKKGVSPYQSLYDKEEQQFYNTLSEQKNPNFKDNQINEQNKYKPTLQNLHKFQNKFEKIKELDQKDKNLQETQTKLIHLQNAPLIIEKKDIQDNHKQFQNKSQLQNEQIWNEDNIKNQKTEQKKKSKNQQILEQGYQQQKQQQEVQKQEEMDYYDKYDEYQNKIHDQQIFKKEDNQNNQQNSYNNNNYYEQESQESFNQTHNQEQLKHERFLESMPVEQNFEDDKNKSHEYFNRTLGEQELKNEMIETNSRSKHRKSALDISVSNTNKQTSDQKKKDQKEFSNELQKLNHKIQIMNNSREKQQQLQQNEESLQQQSSKKLEENSNSMGSSEKKESGMKFRFFNFFRRKSTQNQTFKSAASNDSGGKQGIQNLKNDIYAKDIKKKAIKGRISAFGSSLSINSKEEYKNKNKNENQPRSSKFLALPSSSQSQEFYKNSQKMAKKNGVSQLSSTTLGISPLKEKIQKIENKQSEDKQEKKENIYDDFNLQDLKIIEETLRSNQSALEKELQEYKAKDEMAKIQEPLSDRAGRNWGRVKYQLLSFQKIKNIWINIKKYGTNVQALTGISKKQLDMTKKELLKKQEQNQKINKEKLKLLQQDGKFLFYWNYVLILIYFYTGYVSTVKVCFNDREEGWTEWGIEKMIDFLILIDIIVHFYTPIEKNSQIIFDRKQIAFQYIKTWFFIDILSILPLEALQYVMNADQFTLYHNLLSLPYYNDVLKIIKIPRFYSRFRFNIPDFKHIRVGTASVRLLKFLMNLILQIHILGCIWYYVAKIYDFGPNTWVYEMDKNQEQKAELYIISIYWCIQTLATVGFGDVRAYNTLEQIVSIFWMIVGVVSYSYTVGSLSTLLMEQDYKSYKNQKSQYIFDEFVKVTQLPLSFRKKIRDSLRQNSTRRVLDDTEKEELFEDMPPNQQLDVTRQMFKDIIKSIPFFQSTSIFFQKEILSYLNPVSFKRKEFIYMKGQHPRFVYFIQRGRVNLVVGKKDATFKSFVGGSYFGEIEVLYNVPRMFSVVCNEDCLFLQVEKDIFRFLLEKYAHVKRFIKQNMKIREISMLEALNKIDKFLEIDPNSKFWKKKQESYKQIIKNGRLKQRARTMDVFQRQMMTQSMNDNLHILESKKQKNDTKNKKSGWNLLFGNYDEEESNSEKENDKSQNVDNRGNQNNEIIFQNMKTGIDENNGLNNNNNYKNCNFLQVQNQEVEVPMLSTQDKIRLQRRSTKTIEEYKSSDLLKFLKLEEEQSKIKMSRSKMIQNLNKFSRDYDLKQFQQKKRQSQIQENGQLQQSQHSLKNLQKKFKEQMDDSNKIQINVFDENQNLQNQENFQESERNKVIEEIEEEDQDEESTKFGYNKNVKKNELFFKNKRQNKFEDYLNEKYIDKNDKENILKQGQQSNKNSQKSSNLSEENISEKSQEIQENQDSDFENQNQLINLGKQQAIDIQKQRVLEMQEQVKNLNKFGKIQYKEEKNEIETVIEEQEEDTSFPSQQLIRDSVNFSQEVDKSLSLIQKSNQGRRKQSVNNLNLMTIPESQNLQDDQNLQKQDEQKKLDQKKEDISEERIQLEKDMKMLNEIQKVDSDSDIQINVKNENSKINQINDQKNQVNKISENNQQGDQNANQNESLSESGKKIQNQENLETISNKRRSQTYEKKNPIQKISIQKQLSVNNNSLQKNKVNQNNSKNNNKNTNSSDGKFSKENQDIQNLSKSHRLSAQYRPSNYQKKSQLEEQLNKLEGQSNSSSSNQNLNLKKQTDSSLSLEMQSSLYLGSNNNSLNEVIENLDGAEKGRKGKKNGEKIKKEKKNKKKKEDKDLNEIMKQIQKKRNSSKYLKKKAEKNKKKGSISENLHPLNPRHSDIQGASYRNQKQRMSNRRSMQTFISQNNQETYNMFRNIDEKVQKQKQRKKQKKAKKIKSDKINSSSISSSSSFSSSSSISSSSLSDGESENSCENLSLKNNKNNQNNEENQKKDQLFQENESKKQNKASISSFNNSQRKSQNNKLNNKFSFYSDSFSSSDSSEDKSQIKEQFQGSLTDEDEFFKESKESSYISCNNVNDQVKQKDSSTKHKKASNSQNSLKQEARESSIRKNNFQQKNISNENTQKKERNDRLMQKQKKSNKQQKSLKKYKNLYKESEKQVRKLQVKRKNDKKIIKLQSEQINYMIQKVQSFQQYFTVLNEKIKNIDAEKTIYLKNQNRLEIDLKNCKMQISKQKQKLAAQFGLANKKPSLPNSMVFLGNKRSNNNLEDEEVDTFINSVENSSLNKNQQLLFQSQLYQNNQMGFVSEKNNNKNYHNINNNLIGVSNLSLNKMESVQHSRTNSSTAFLQSNLKQTQQIQKENLKQEQEQEQKQQGQFNLQNNDSSRYLIDNLQSQQTLNMDQKLETDNKQNENYNYQECLLSDSNSLRQSEHLISDSQKIQIQNNNNNFKGRNINEFNLDYNQTGSKNHKSQLLQEQQVTQKSEFETDNILLDEQFNQQKNFEENNNNLNINDSNIKNNSNNKILNLNMKRKDKEIKEKAKINKKIKNSFFSLGK